MQLGCVHLRPETEFIDPTPARANQVCTLKHFRNPSCAANLVWTVDRHNSPILVESKHRARYRLQNKRPEPYKVSPCSWLRSLGNRSLDPRNLAPADLSHQAQKKILCRKQTISTEWAIYRHTATNKQGTHKMPKVLVWSRQAGFWQGQSCSC